MSQSLYTNAFFDQIDNAALRSASVVVPLVLELVPAQSVVDIGCGRGAWLSVFLQHGVSDILGVDGSYVDRTSLLIEQASFRESDLAEPHRLDSRFDLAVNLEVAEHLPPCAGEALVDVLVAAAPAVLFSAAIPGQGGTHHINEQWPWYWQKLFAERGYQQLDVIRPQIWGNPHVDWWYQQNIFLYVDAQEIRRSDTLQRMESSFRTQDLHLVHKDNLSATMSLRGLLKRIPAAARSAVKRRFN